MSPFKSSPDPSSTTILLFCLVHTLHTYQFYFDVTEADIVSTLYIYIPFELTISGPVSLTFKCQHLTLLGVVFFCHKSPHSPHAQQAKNAGELQPSEAAFRRLQAVGRWWIHTPTSSPSGWNESEEYFNAVSQVPGRIKFQIFTEISCLITYPLFISFSSLS